MVAIPVINGVSIYDIELPETIRQVATDAEMEKFQDRVQKFFNEYKLHGQDDSYRERFHNLKSGLNWDINVFKGKIDDSRYSVSNKPLILKKIAEYTSKLSEVRVEYQLVRGINIFDERIETTVRQQATDAVTLELQGLVEDCCKEYDVHGKENLYLDYFQDFIEKINKNINFINSFINKDAYTFCNKAAIKANLAQYKAQIGIVEMNFKKRRSSVRANSAIRNEYFSRNSHIPSPIVNRPDRQPPGNPPPSANM